VRYNERLWGDAMIRKIGFLETLFAILLLTLTGLVHSTYAQDPSGRPKEPRRRPSTKKPPAKPEPQVMTVILTVLTDPPEAAVYVNGDKRGVTNTEGRIQFDKLPVGHYTVEVKKEGYHAMLRGFEAGSESPTLVFKLEPDLESYLKEFDSLLAAGKLAGPESPNALEFVDRLSTRFPGRPEIERLRGVLAAKFTETVAPVITHTINDWRGVGRPEIVQALDGTMNALALIKDDVRYRANAAYLRGVLSLRDWQTKGRVQGGDSGPEVDLLGAAKTEFEKAVSLQDSFAAARYQLGVVLLATFDTGGAEAAFVKTMQLEPQWIFPRLGLGATYQAQSKFKEAIEAYRKAMEVDPKSAVALAGIGYARWSKGEKDGIKDLERSIQLDPSCAVAHFNLGLAYSKSKSKKDVAKAEGELKTAIQLNPNNLEFSNNVAEQRMADLKKKKK
jgi:tetratricopeptide (TPR) repeat protein